MCLVVDNSLGIKEFFFSHQASELRSLNMAWDGVCNKLKYTWILVRRPKRLKPCRLEALFRQTGS